MKRLTCTEEELAEQFEMVYRNKMVALARELKEAKARGQPVLQHSLWKGFFERHGNSVSRPLRLSSHHKYTSKQWMGGEGLYLLGTGLSEKTEQVGCW